MNSQYFNERKPTEILRKNLISERIRPTSTLNNTSPSTAHWGKFMCMPRSIPKLFFVALFLLLGFSRGYSTHIVGAEIYYECVNPFTDQYRIHLIMLRDCLNGEAPFDDPIQLFVFRSATGIFDRIIEVDLPLFQPEIEPDGWDECIGQPYNLCVESAEYSALVTLPAITGGYDIGWARCCRNALIDNLANPLNQGVTFTTHIPGPEDANCNNSPVFNQRLPIFICAGQTFTFDQSANDPDGDSLVYELTNPFGGLNSTGFGVGNGMFGNNDPIVLAGINPMGSPPYENVNYNGSFFDFNNPFGPGTASMDPVSGQITFSPPNPGIFVVAFSVFEYRDGVLLSENKVDLQIHVMACLDQGVPPDIDHDFSGLDTTAGGISLTYGSNDTIYAIAGTPFCYDIQVSDSVLSDAVTSFLENTDNIVSPKPTWQFLTGPNPHTARICWAPACIYIGDTLAIIAGGQDTEGCENHNLVFDTIFIVVEDPPNVFPIVDKDLSGAALVIGDTIILEHDESMCFNWSVTDSLNQGHIGFDIDISEVGGVGGIAPVTTFERFGDSIALQTCWTASCAEVGKLFEVILIGWDNSFCPPDNEDRDTLYIRIPEIPNPPPIVSADLAGNIFVDDTIYVDVHDSLCYLVTIDDTFPGTLSYDLWIQEVSGSFSGTVPIETVLINDDSLVVEICWTPDCNHTDGLFRPDCKRYANQ